MKNLLNIAKPFLIIIALSIQQSKTACIPDGSNCRYDSQCCSTFCDGGICKFTTNCGGNCQGSEAGKKYCWNCACIQNPNYIDVDQYCKTKDWDQTCCKCIINYMNKGNERYQMQYMDGVHAIGPLPTFTSCCLSPKLESELCDWKVSVQCAYNQYKKGGWSGIGIQRRSTWFQACKACGCGCYQSKSDVKQTSLQNQERLENQME